MPHQPTVSEATEFDGLPRLLPDQNAVLVGRVSDDSEYGGLAAYYVHGRGNVLIGEYENREFVPEYAIDCDRRLLSACVHAFATTDVATELSTAGEALLQAWNYGDLTSLSHQQAHVYALRERGGFGRTETAELLNLSPNTVDTHLLRAKEKRKEAEVLVELDTVDPDDPDQPGFQFLDETGTDADDDREHSNDVTPYS